MSRRNNTIELANEKLTGTIENQIRSSSALSDNNDHPDAPRIRREAIVIYYFSDVFFSEKIGSN